MRDAFFLAGSGTASAGSPACAAVHSCCGYRRGRASDHVDKQRARSTFSWHLAIQDNDLIGEVTALKQRIYQFNHDVADHILSLIHI